MPAIRMDQDCIAWDRMAFHLAQRGVPVVEKNRRRCHGRSSSNVYADQWEPENEKSSCGSSIVTRLLIAPPRSPVLSCRSHNHSGQLSLDRRAILPKGHLPPCTCAHQATCWPLPAAPPWASIIMPPQRWSAQAGAGCPDGCRPSCNCTRIINFHGTVELIMKFQHLPSPEIGSRRAREEEWCDQTSSEAASLQSRDENDWSNRRWYPLPPSPSGDRDRRPCQRTAWGLNPSSKLCHSGSDCSAKFIARFWLRSAAFAC